MALLITSSGGLTTALASSKNGRIWTSITGILTTLAGTVMGGIRAMGQPRRAEDRVRRLERIIEHIGRLYYITGPGEEGTSHERAIQETWKMIDEEEDRTELEERKAGHFGYQAEPSPPPSSSMSPIDQHPRGDGSSVDQGDSSDSNQQRRARLEMRRASTLLGNHYSSSSVRRAQ